MWLHLGTAAGLLLVILGLVYFFARQIAQPIRRLASVADQGSRSGDYTMRAAFERDPRGADEIGQLFGAFNGMLGELDRDRDRAMREELAATTRAKEARRQLLTSFPTPLIVTSIPAHRVLHANAPALHWLAGLTTDPWMACLEPADRARYFQRLSDLGSVDGFEVRWKTPSTPAVRCSPPTAPSPAPPAGTRSTWSARRSTASRTSTIRWATTSAMRC